MSHSAKENVTYYIFFARSTSLVGDATIAGSILYNQLFIRTYYSQKYLKNKRNFKYSSVEICPLKLKLEDIQLTVFNISFYSVPL